VCFVRYKERKKYGIDCDGVCADFIGGFLPLLNTHCDRTGERAIKVEDVKDYYWYKCVDGLDKNDFWDAFEVFCSSGGFGRLEMFEGAQETIRLLQRHGEVFFVTHRPASVLQDTQEWLKKNFGARQDQIILTDKKKSIICKDLSLDVFIEDAPHNLVDLVTNTRCQVYCRDHLYNRDLDDTWMRRVKSLREFLQWEGLVD